MTSHLCGSCCDLMKPAVAAAGCEAVASAWDAVRRMRCWRLLGRSHASHPARLDL